MKRFIFITMLFVAVFCSAAWADTITLVTYYPAPFGMYQEMRVMGKLGVGTTNPGTAKVRIESTSATDGILVVGDTSTTAIQGSSAIGNGATASGQEATAIGRNAVASGKPSIAIDGATASGNGSIAMGDGAIASGDNAAAIGSNITAQSYNSVVVGTYNIVGGTSSAPSVLTDPIFVIGNGTGSGARLNAVTVLKNGNVGIGTTAPIYPLEVVKSSTGAETIPVSLRNSFNTANTAVGLGFSPHGAGTLTGKISNIITSVGSYALAFYTLGLPLSLTEKMRITGDGNVGIGTTAPAVKLDVVGAIRTSVSSTDYGALEQGSSTPNLFLRYSNTDRVRITSNGISYLNGGNVGIGITAPGLRTEIVGTMGWPATSGGTQNGALRIGGAGVGSSVVLDMGINGQLGALGGGWLQSTNKFNLASANPLFLNPNGGNVGIGMGTTTPPGYRLQVGNAADGSQARANAWGILSDIRLKKNLAKLTGALDKISQINGYYFNWNVGTDKKRQFGVIAQEVEKVLPEVVSEDSEGFKSVEYGKLSPLVIEAIKELKAENNALKKRIEALEAKIKK